MGMNKWINKSLPDVISRLEKDIVEGFHIQAEEGLNISGRNAICEVLDDMLAVMFPGGYAREKVSKEELSFFLGDTLRHISLKLKKQINDIFEYNCGKDNCDDCAERALNACKKVVESLPDIRKELLDDITAAFDSDHAAKSLNEIIISYPCIEAIATYRIAHMLYELDVPMIPRIMTEHAHSNTGIDIHPGAKIGSHFFIDHGTGVVIGETCTIGRNVKIYQGVTLGARSPFDSMEKTRRGEKRHPDIEDDVIIYSNATILGGDTVIGKGAIVGGNTWITKSVSPGSIVLSENKEIKQ